MALYGFQVIARSIIEGAASAAWILDPAINIRDRVIRAALLEHEAFLKPGRSRVLAEATDRGTTNKSWNSGPLGADGHRRGPK